MTMIRQKQRGKSLFSNENKPFFCNTIIRHLALANTRDKGNGQMGST